MKGNKYRLSIKEMEQGDVLISGEYRHNRDNFNELWTDLYAPGILDKKLAQGTSEEDLGHLGQTISEVGVTPIALLDRGGMGAVFIGLQNLVEAAFMKTGIPRKDLEATLSKIGPKKFTEQFQVDFLSRLWACKYLLHAQKSLPQIPQRFQREGRLLQGTGKYIRHHR